MAMTSPRTKSCGMPRGRWGTFGSIPSAGEWRGGGLQWESKTVYSVRQNLHSSQCKLCTPPSCV